MTSSAFDITTLVKALDEATQFIKQIILEEKGFTPVGNLVWNPVEAGNTEQFQFVQRFEAVNADLSKFGELKAWASWKAEDLNKILAEKGFSIRLDPWADDRTTFGIVAIYDLTIEWLVKGSVNNERGNPYLINDRPAFRLETDDAGIGFYNVDGQVLIRIPGRNQGDFLCLVQDTTNSGFELLERVEDFRQKMHRSRPLYEWGGVILPNILLDQEVDVSWLAGLWAEDETKEIWWVKQAKMQVKFALGPKGARAKVAAAIAMTREAFSMPKPDYIVNHDVIIWMERESVTSTPLLVAWVPVGDFATETVDIDKL